MQIWGLHYIDAAIILGYIIGVLLIGEYLSRKVRSEAEFFLAGRKLGRWFQFFLNFGNMAGDPSFAALTAASVYSQGVGGVWLSLVPLFITPYYWFMNPWFRRVRLTTIADLFKDRFGGSFLASLFAIVSILTAPLTLGLANVVALKTLEPIMAKPENLYNADESQMVQQYREFIGLKKKSADSSLSPDEQARYSTLSDLYQEGHLKRYVSYLKPLPFYLLSSLLVCVFIMMGGLKASAIVDAVQSVLVIAISFILIPFGLARIGGLHGLHTTLPDYMFQLFGTEASGEYTSGSILAFLLLTFVGINAAPGNMSIAGSAKNELAAGLGAVGGGFAKRLVTIAWCFCGLIAAALFGPGMSDPDEIWGSLTRATLPVGLIGFMLVGLLGGKLAALGAQSIILSALSVKNIYEPLFPGKSERHYVWVARLTIPGLLLMGILVALYFTSAISLVKMIAVLTVIWGAPILLIFLWRRLTEKAVCFQVIICLVFVAIIPLGLSFLPSVTRAPSLTVLTDAKTVEITVRAGKKEVAEGLADHQGQLILRKHLIEPVSVFFEDGVVHVEPDLAGRSLQGRGRFNMEIYLVSLLGMKVKEWTPAQLLATRYLVDSLLPFLILFGVSLITQPTDPRRTARFYARLKTPVAATPEEDKLAVKASEEDPGRYDHTKLFPRSNWELTQWNRLDLLGFLGCCAVVGLVLLLFEFFLGLA